MKTKLLKWFMIILLSLSALTGCFVGRGGDGYHRDRDHWEHHDGDRWEHHNRSDYGR